MSIEGEISDEIVSLLQSKREEVLEAWSGVVNQNLRGRITPQEVNRDLARLLDAVTIALSSASGVDADSSAFDETKALLAEMSRTRARQGFSPRETAVAVFGLKDVVLERAEGTALSEINEFSRALDGLGLYTFEAYAQERESVIAEQSAQLLELSTPVIKLWEGIVAVPLVGTLDSARTQVVMETLLQTLVDTESDVAIIDITGVPAVDTQVAQHLLKTVVAARLMGAQCIVSGIRPQIAQTIVALGIEFGDIVTKATLADALVLALRQRGTGMVQLNKRA